MPKHKVNWVNDHTQICDRLNARGLAHARPTLTASPTILTVSLSNGIATKRFLLDQAREQVAWYRQTEYRRDSAFPILPKLWTRHDDETRFDDAGETPDDRLFDLY